MIIGDGDATSEAHSLTSLAVDRLSLTVALGVMSHVVVSGTSVPVAASAVLGCVAVLAIAVNGSKLVVKKRMTSKQMSSIGIVAFAVLALTYTVLFALRVLGTFRSAVLLRYTEYAILYAPALSSLNGLLPPLRAPGRKPSSSQARLGVACIALAFAVIVLTPTSLGALPVQQAAGDNDGGSGRTPAPESDARPHASFFPIEACLALFAGSVVMSFLRRYLGSGVSGTGFPNARRLYGLAVCLAAAAAIPIATFSVLFRATATTTASDGDASPPRVGSSLPALLVYPVAALAWYIYNAPGRTIPPVTQALPGLGMTIVASLVVSVCTGSAWHISWTSILVVIMTGAAAYQLGGSSIADAFLARHGRSNVARGVFRHIMETRNSRRIFVFLCINFAFTLVEIAYGYWSNSIGLISDAVHMLFDCTALGIGLYASYVSRLNANDEFTYGYGRFEVVSGLVNGIFLVLISFSVFVESVERLFDPPEIEGFEILVVAVVGLLVNIVGIVFFHDAHHHHGHSHGGGCESGHNSNMEGIYLHVLADALGSVGVIVSSLLVHLFGWLIADPICSLLIAVLILMSVWQLLRETSLVLLQRTPASVERRMPNVLHEITSLPGVIGYRDFHAWSFTTTWLVGSIHVHVDAECNAQTMLSKIAHVLRSNGMSQVTVQVETQALVDGLEPETRMRYHMHNPAHVPSLIANGFAADRGHCSHGHGHAHDGHDHAHDAGHGHSHGP
ncbi:Cation efflux protein cytoplasmic domain-containing protein [Plasmodiophora brassicae]